MNTADIIRRVQQIENQLRGGTHLPLIDVDGNDGPQTLGAIFDRYQRLLPTPSPTPTPPVPFNHDTTSPRSEKKIMTLHAKVQPYARALWFGARKVGIEIEILDGTRTYAEQTALYNQPNDGKDNDGDGRVDEPDERVTRAPAGYSNHNFGLAFDIGIFQGGQYLGESPSYKAVGAVGINLGLAWGGSWHSFVDEPHFELRPAWAKDMSEDEMLGVLRSRVKANLDVFA